jgi:hypothetical protein
MDLMIFGVALGLSFILCLTASWAVLDVVLLLIMRRGSWIRRLNLPTRPAAS